MFDAWQSYTAGFLGIVLIALRMRGKLNRPRKPNQHRLARASFFSLVRQRYGTPVMSILVWATHLLRYPGRCRYLRHFRAGTLPGKTLFGSVSFSSSPVDSLATA